jgi:hypothetical protein
MTRTILVKSMGMSVMVCGMLFAHPFSLTGQETAPEPEHTLQDKPPEPTQMTRYYLGKTVTAGPFPGRLVCLRCDTMPTPENVTFCEKNGHRHTLVMEGDTMIHPLLFDTEELFKRVGTTDWYRKRVKVSGKYYSDTGFILVSDIQLLEE